jgi:uncharacterized protein
VNEPIDFRALRAKQRYRQIIRATPAVVPVSAAVLAVAEVLVGQGIVVAGMLVHAALLLVLLCLLIAREHALYGRVLPALALAPLMRILSLALAIQQIPQIYWYALAGTPLLIALARTIRLLDLSALRLGLRLWSLPVQLLIACCGVPLSIVAPVVLRPIPLAAGSGWYDLVIGSAILLIFTGFAEELLFRGVLQRVLVETFGWRGVLYAGGLYALMHVSSLSWNYVLFAAAMGLFFGWCVFRTGSIWGVVLAHGLMNVGAAFAWPLANRALGAAAIERVAAIGQLGLWLILAVVLGFAAMLLYRWALRLVAPVRPGGSWPPS